MDNNNIKQLCKQWSKQWTEKMMYQFHIHHGIPLNKFNKKNKIIQKETLQFTKVNDHLVKDNNGYIWDIYIHKIVGTTTEIGKQDI